MDTRSTTAEPKHIYPTTSPWPSSPNPSSASPSTPATQSSDGSSPFPKNFEIFPFLYPQQSFFQDRLLQYNNLISPSRGGGIGTAQPPPLVAPSSPHNGTPRSRSGSKVSNKDNAKGVGGHGSRAVSAAEKGHRAVITGRDAPHKMAPKQAELSHPLPGRPAPAGRGQSHSSSVPSTPHQHARNFSFESREPSPNATTNHSPRSSYSETNPSLPSLRPLPPRLGGCQYETAQANSRRRIPYSVGSDDLERMNLDTLRSKLSEDDERKLTTDMRELYNRLLPTPAIEKKRQVLVAKLEKILNDEWPGHDIRVHLFGSSGNLLCSDDSDVDICITTPWKELEGVCMIAELLARRGMEKVVCISAAKVPIVKIWDPELDLACDMNVNNTLALENTRMVRTYVEIDERVRPLAMIIKYWIRRRIINDAAFGGTFSSYTWICLVIAFLQLREPPVVPALHQCEGKRLPKPTGETSEFADDVDQLRGFGAPNEASIGDLLFQFFRFYAHEFDYDKNALSVRLGRLVPKREKNWQRASNNKLCIEEPFNTSRNLGNTADEYSFRGVHLELRRAFDLILEGKLEEACEQYVFPKEEERVYTRQAQQPRPVLMRSASQTHTGRGGGGRGNYNGRGGRHHSNYSRNGNSNNRRASSGVAFEPLQNALFLPPLTLQDYSFYQSPQTPQELIMSFALQPHPDNSFRYQQLYSYAAAPTMAAPQHQHRMASNGTASQTTGSERSRTNSVDTPPLSAPPIRPELYTAVYGLPMHAQQVGSFYTQPVPGVYTSPPASHADFRRTSQRASGTGDSGASSQGSTLRSHSQPASRTAPATQSSVAYSASSLAPSSNGLPTFPPFNPNGIPIPSFIPDDGDCEETPTKTSAGGSPPLDNGTPSSCDSANSPGARPAGATNGIAFGDIHHQPAQNRRRFSVESPQTILGRRIRRTSRSPSPQGHARALSVGTPSVPLTSAPFPPSADTRNTTRPLVVNGSSKLNPLAAQQRLAYIPDGLVSGESPVGYDNPLRIHIGQQTARSISPETPAGATSQGPSSSLPERPPVVVNGTNPTLMHLSPTTEDASFRDRIAMMRHPFFQPAGVAYPDFAAAGTSTSTRQRLMTRQNHSAGVIAPLDLATDYRIGMSPLNTDLPRLSPIGEGRSPSPTAVRKPETPIKSGRGTSGTKEGRGAVKANKDSASNSSDNKSGLAKAHTTAGTATQGGTRSSGNNNRPHQTAKPQHDGHDGNGRDVERITRHDGSSADGGWQKATKNRRKEFKSQPNGHSHGEQPPRHESERKGG